jgi:hypothetical protein
VKLKVYLRYFRAMGFGLTAIFVFGLLTSTIASMGRNLWLTDWSNDNARISGKEPKPISLRLGVYATIGFLEGTYCVGVRHRD